MTSEVGRIPMLITVGALAALIVWGAMPSRKRRSGRKGKKGKKGGKPDRVDVGDRSTTQSELRPMTEYAAIAPDFDAPLDVNASARCEYCGSVLQSSEHDWAICSIKALSQQTV